MSKLFIVSNRLPVTATRGKDGQVALKRSSGGLVAGLQDVVGDPDTLWVGYAGPSGDLDESLRTALTAERLVPVELDDEDYHRYYVGLANGAIWPLFHYFPRFMGFATEPWDAYVRANQRFADALLAQVKPGDRVWVHDYHLMLLPALLRAAEPRLRIAYFHHIPFPSSEMFRIFPMRRQILDGLLGADLVGFHTLDYARHFSSCVTRLLGAEVERDEIHHSQRTTKVGAFPLGVDVARTEELARQHDAPDWMEALEQSLAGKDVFLGIDRLDYSKGIPERIRAFRHLLATHPELIGKVTFLQVCVPSREGAPFYKELREEIERLVGQINGEFGRPGYVPLQYLYQGFSPEQVVQFYRLGDVMVVTPLRDGLNLVCKEFVAAQDEADPKPGVLVLSEFAGAAAEMGEALLVNPFDAHELASRLYEALTMPHDERARRLSVLRRRVASYNNVEWSQDFRNAWEEAVDLRAPRCETVTTSLVDEIVTTLTNAPQPVRLFLDYDGTLTPIRRRPEEALPSPELLALLARLASHDAIELAIVSGRSRAFCEDHFGHLTAHLVAEHSTFWRPRGGIAWQATFPEEDWPRVRAVVMPHLARYVQRIPGAHVEEKEASLVLHYREAEQIFASSQALELLASLNEVLHSTPYLAQRAKRALEIKPVAGNKGVAVERILARAGQAPGPFLTAGDDVGDDVMFKVRPELNLSVRVGPGPNFARYRVETPAEMLRLLTAIADALPLRRMLDAETKLHRKGADGSRPGSDREAPRQERQAGPRAQATRRRGHGLERLVSGERPARLDADGRGALSAP